METGPGLKVSSDRLLKPGIEPATPDLQGKRFIHYATAAPKKTTWKAGEEYAKDNTMHRETHCSA